MTFEDVPPGQVPTRMTPMASSAGRRNRWQRAKARSGMIVYCSTAPMTTSLGLWNTTAKSWGFNVRPMPNMTMPSRVFTQLVLIQDTVPGANRESAAIAMTMSAMYLPTKSLTFSSVFILAFLPGLLACAPGSHAPCVSGAYLRGNVLGTIWQPLLRGGSLCRSLFPHKKASVSCRVGVLPLLSCVRDKGLSSAVPLLLAPKDLRSALGSHSCASINARPSITGVFRRHLLAVLLPSGTRHLGFLLSGRKQFSTPELREDSPVGSGTASHRMAALCNLLPQDASRQRRMIPFCY